MDFIPSLRNEWCQAWISGLPTFLTQMHLHICVDTHTHTECFTWYLLISNYVTRGPCIPWHSRVVPLAGVVNTDREDPQEGQGSHNGTCQLQDGQW